MVLQFKLAIPDQAPLVHQIVQSAFAQYIGKMPMPPEALNETLEEVTQVIGQGQTILAWDGPTAIATVRYQVHPDSLYARRLAVLPSYRGQGVGVALMEYLEELAPRLGCNLITLNTRQSIRYNLEFYQKLGYQITKFEPYPKAQDVTVWFSKQLLS